MDFILAIISGLTLGIVHAFDADHVAAVTAFTSDNPDPKKAATVGITWGLGHTATLVVMGGICVLAKFAIPPIVQTTAELAIGILLVGLGLWILIDLFRRRQIHIHRHVHDGHEHAHFHSHRESRHHHHRHSVFLVGVAHGAAGTGSILVLVPVALTQSAATAAAYLLLFGVGTIIAMAAIAFLIGVASRGARSRNLLPVLRLASGIASFAIGCIWIGQRVLS